MRKKHSFLYINNFQNLRGNFFIHNEKYNYSRVCTMYIIYMSQALLRAGLRVVPTDA